MANRPILEIDIDDSAFQGFLQKFNEHQEVMKALPSYWTAAGQEIEKQKTNFEKISSRLAAAGDSSIGIEKAQEGVGKLLEGAAISLGLLGTQGKLFAANIVRSTQSLLKWTKLTSLFAGIVGAGGLFGINRMATSVAGQRTSATGLGISYTEQASFLTNFRALGNPEAILKGFSEALSTPVGKAQIAHLIGHRPTGDAAETAAEALPKFKELVDKTPDEQLAKRLEALGYTKLGLGVEQAKAIRGIPREEIAERTRAYREGKTSALALDPAMAKKWTEFTTQMELAGRELEATFARGLAKLTPSLTDLSNAFVHLIDNLLKDGSPIKGWIDKLGKGLDDLVKSMESRGFQEGVSSFIRASTALIHAVERITTMSLKDILEGMRRGMDASRADIEQRYGKDWNAVSGLPWLQGAKPADPSDYKITSTRPGGSSVTPTNRFTDPSLTPSQNELAAVRGSMARTMSPGGPGSPGTPSVTHARHEGEPATAGNAPVNEQIIEHAFDAAKRHPDWGIIPGRVNTVPVYGPGGEKWMVAPKAQKDFQAFIDDLHKTHPEYNIKSSGGYVSRPKREGHGWSMHAYGTAIDINAESNPFGDSGKTDMPPDIAGIAARHGIAWGGNFSRKKDPMHFEYTGVEPRYGGSSERSTDRSKFGYRGIGKHPAELELGKPTGVDVVDHTGGSASVDVSH